MDRARKQVELDSLKETLGDSELLVVSHNKGLTVAQVTELRRDLAKTGAKYKVTKNTLTKIAAKGTKFGIRRLLLSGFMTGQCVYCSAVDGIEKGFEVLVLKDTTADSRDRYETDIETLFHLTGVSLSDMKEFKKEGLAVLNKRNEPVCC